MIARHEKILQQSTVATRKLFSAKGKLQGNFYFVTGEPVDSEDPTAVLLVTLAARDKRGMQAVSMGKLFRKLFKGTIKFARGGVLYQDGKLTLAHKKGNATPKVIRTALRETVSKNKGLAFMKKAQIVSASKLVEPEEPAPELSEEEAREVAADEESAFFEALDDSELRALIEEQGDLETLRSDLELFHTGSDEDLEKRHAAELTAALDELRQLPDDLAARKEAYARLAELTAVGPIELSGEEDALSPELAAVLESVDTMARQGLQQLAARLADAQAFWKNNTSARLSELIAQHSPHSLRDLISQCADALDREDAQAADTLLTLQIEPLIAKLRPELAKLDPRESEGARRLAAVEEALDGLGSAASYEALAGRIMQTWLFAERELSLFLITVRADIQRDPQYPEFKKVLDGIRLPPVDMTLIEEIERVGTIADPEARKKATRAAKSRLDEGIRSIDRLPLIRITSEANPFGLFDVHGALSASLRLISEKLAALST